MEKITCHSCGEGTSSEFSFCEHCQIQVICLNKECLKPLVLGKSICLYCGQPLMIIDKQTQSNTFTRYRKQEGQDFEEEIKINMTDHAVTELAPFVAGQIIPRDSRYPDSPPRFRTVNEKQLTSPLADNNDDYSDAEYNAGDEEPAESDLDLESSEATQNAKSSAYKYFEKNGEKMVVKEKDFKGKDRKEQQKRFLLLYTAAYFHYFQKPVPPKDEYRKAAKAVNLYNHKNFTTYLNLVTGKFMFSLTEGFKLNTSGEKEVERIIKEIENEQVKAGYPYWERTSQPTKQLRLTKEDKSKITKWVESEVNLGKLQIGDLKKGLDYALVGIWILTVHLKKEKAVRWIDVYYYLKEKFTTIKATPNAFVLALRGSNADEYIVKTGDLLYLNSQGIKKVEKWIEGDS
jgi:hypothetical protein